MLQFVMHGEHSFQKIINDWHYVSSDYSEEKLCWCLERCQSKFWNRSNNWYFSNEQDATMFAIKYSEKALYL